MVMVIVIDDAKISQFLVVSEELVMVMMTMMPRFVGFLPIKPTNLVVSEEMVQYNKICCFILLYFGDRL